MSCKMQDIFYYHRQFFAKYYNSIKKLPYIFTEIKN